MGTLHVASYSYLCTVSSEAACYEVYMGTQLNMHKEELSKGMFLQRTMCTQQYKCVHMSIYMLKVWHGENCVRNNRPRILT